VYKLRPKTPTHLLGSGSSLLPTCLLLEDIGDLEYSRRPPLAPLSLDLERLLFSLDLSLLSTGDLDLLPDLDLSLLPDLLLLLSADLKSVSGLLGLSLVSDMRGDLPLAGPGLLPLSRDLDLDLDLDGIFVFQLSN